MDVVIKPGRASGTIDAIGSKSDAHRLLICAALSSDSTEIKIGALSDDILATMACLRGLGAKVEPTSQGSFLVMPGPPPKEGPRFFCGESGSTLRFLLPIAAALLDESTFDGEGRLPSRPIDALTKELAAHGCRLKGSGLPLHISGGLKGGRFTLPGNVSSQFISGLLFALPLLKEDSHITITSPMESAGYVEMTLSALSRFSILIDKTPSGFFIKGGQRYISPRRIDCDGDWSNGAFLLALGALGEKVGVRGLDPVSVQADRAIEGLLSAFGASLVWDGNTLLARPAVTLPQRIDVSMFPDLFPVLAVLACAAKGETVLYNASRLRLKESDRIASTAAMLRHLGGRVKEGADNLVIEGGGTLDGGETHGFSDHRLVMSAAASASICQKPVVIKEAQAVNKSYPGFFDHLIDLGIEVKPL